MKLLFLFLLSNILLFASIGKITAVNGKVIVDRDKQSLEATVGFNLEEKDFVSTLDNSKVQIIMDDGTVLTLGKNSKLNIHEYLFDQRNQQDSKANFKFVEGTFKSITGAIGKIAPDRFKLETKSATIGIRGTIVIGNQEKVACTQGQIAVTSAGVTQILGAGMMTTTEIGKPPTPPTKIEGNLLKEIDSVGSKENKTTTNENSTAKSTEEKSDNKEKTSEKEQNSTTQQTNSQTEQSNTQSSVQQNSITQTPVSQSSISSNNTIQNNLTSISQISSNITKITSDTTSSTEAARLKAEAAAALALEEAKKKADADTLAATEAARLKAEANATRLKAEADEQAKIAATEAAKIASTISLATEALETATQAVLAAQTDATKAANAAAIALANAQAASSEVKVEAQTVADLAQAAADLAAQKVLEAKNALNDLTIIKTNISTATTSSIAQAFLSDITTAQNTILAAGNTTAIAAINAQNQSKIITNIPFYSVSVPINQDIGFSSIGFNVPTSNTNIKLSLYITNYLNYFSYPEIQIFKEENGNYTLYQTSTMELIGTSVLNLNLEAGNYRISAQGNFLNNENLDFYITSDKRLFFDDNNIKNYSYSNRKNNIAYLETANNSNIISEENKAEFGALVDSKVGTTILIKNADKNYSGEFVTISDSFLYLTDFDRAYYNRYPIEVTDGSSWGYWTGNVNDFSDDQELGNIYNFNSTWISGNQVTPSNKYKATFQGQIIGKISSIDNPMYEATIPLDDNNIFKATIDIGSGTITNSVIKFTTYSFNTAKYWLGIFDTSDVNKVNISGFSSNILGTTADYYGYNIKNLTGSLSGNYFGITNADGSQDVKSIGGQFTMTNGTEVAAGVFKASNGIKYLHNITYLVDYGFGDINNLDFMSLVDSKINTSKYIQSYYMNINNMFSFDLFSGTFVTMPDSFLVDYINSNYDDYYTPDNIDLNNEIADGSSWGYYGTDLLNVWLSGNKIIPNTDYKATFNGQVIGYVSGNGNNYASILLNKANSFGATVDIGSTTITNSHISFIDSIGGIWSGTFDTTNMESDNPLDFASRIIGYRLSYKHDSDDGFNPYYFGIFYLKNSYLSGKYFGTTNADGSQNIKSIGGQFTMSDGYNIASGVFKANNINNINPTNNIIYLTDISLPYPSLIDWNNSDFKSLADTQVNTTKNIQSYGYIMLNNNTVITNYDGTFVTMPDSFLVDYSNYRYDDNYNLTDLNNEIIDGSSWGYWTPANYIISTDYPLNVWLTGNKVVPNQNYIATFNGQVIGSTNQGSYILLDNSNAFSATIDIGSSRITNSYIQFRDSVGGFWSGTFNWGEVNQQGFSAPIYDGKLISGEDSPVPISGYLSGNYFGTTNPDGSQNVKSIGGQFTMSDYYDTNVATGVFKANNAKTIHNITYTDIDEVYNYSNLESLVDSEVNIIGKNIQIYSNYYNNIQNPNRNFVTMPDSFLENYSYFAYNNPDVSTSNNEIPDDSSWGYWAEVVDPNENSISTINQLNVWVSGNKVIANQDYKATFSGQVIGSVSQNGRILLDNENSFNATIDIGSATITKSNIHFNDSLERIWSGTFDTSGKANVNSSGFSSNIEGTVKVSTTTFSTSGSLAGSYFGTINADGSQNVKSIGGTFNMTNGANSSANGIFKARHVGGVE